MSTQNGAVRLPGVLVSVHDSNGAERSQQVTDTEGRVRIAELADGRYRVTATLEGFQAVESTVIVAGGRSVPLLIDLPFAMTTRVEVKAPRAGISGSETLGTTEALKDKETDRYARRAFSALRFSPA